MKTHDLILENESHTRTASLHNLAADRNEEFFNVHPIDGRGRRLREDQLKSSRLLAVHDCI